VTYTVHSLDQRGAVYEGRLLWGGFGKVPLISIRRISLGGGYRCLLRSVAADNGAGEPPQGTLGRYYDSSGTPPGVFLGAGLAHLDSGRGVAPGTQVSEQHLERMFVACADPVSGQPVGAASRWPVRAHLQPGEVHLGGLGPGRRATKAVIYGCHRRAVEAVLAYAEAEVFLSRSGTNGVVEEDVAGVAAWWPRGSATGLAGPTTPTSTTSRGSTLAAHEPADLVRGRACD
jgi:TrwC relaxase